MSWYSNIYKKGLAVIPTEKYDNLFVLTAKQLDINKYLIEAVTKVNNNVQEYTVKKFVVSRGATGMWTATRKNNTTTSKLEGGKACVAV